MCVEIHGDDRYFFTTHEESPSGGRTVRHKPIKEGHDMTNNNYIPCALVSTDSKNVAPDKYLFSPVKVKNENGYVNDQKFCLYKLVDGELNCCYT